MASISEEHFAKVKDCVLSFEREFYSKNGRKPSKDDIAGNIKIRNYYKFYWKFASNFKTSSSAVNSSKNSENVDSDTSKPKQGVWGSNLNKSKVAQTSGGQKLEDIDRFQATCHHVRRVIGGIYQQQKKDSSVFSIRNRKASLLKKSFQVSEEIKAQALLAQNNDDCDSKPTQVNETITNKSVQNDADLLQTVPPNFIQFNPEEDAKRRLQIPENATAESLFESILNPSEPVFCEFDEDFNSFDHLNTFIKDSVIGQMECEDGFIKTKLTFETDPSLLPPKSPVKNVPKEKDLFEFTDSPEKPFQNFETQGQKRSRIYIDDDGDYLSITNTSTNIFNKRRTVEDNDISVPRSNFEDLPDDDNDCEDFRPTFRRKFFKSEGRNVDIQRINDFYEFDDDSGLPGNCENISTNIIPFAETLNSSAQNVSDDSGTKLDGSPDVSKTSPKASNTEKKTAKSKTSTAASKVKKTSVSKKTTSRVEKGNYQRLTMKKRFVKGNKNFNMRKYKFQSWAANKRKSKGEANTCFKCGEAGHWASQCTNEVSSSVEQGVSVDSTQIEERPEMDFETRPINYFADKEAIPRKIFDDIDDPDLEELVQEGLKVFGFYDFRPNQKITVKRILCGKSTLLISPTGSGKSLCYQLAAWCFWKKRQYITLVISPLISLMQDQISNFPPGLTPVTLNSSMSDREKEDAISSLVFNKAQVLFLSPECIVGSGGLNSLGFETLQRVGFVCIDEAHCLAEWSINFRPSYLHLFKILNNRYGISNFLGLTATATKETQKIVCKNLKITVEDDVVGKTWVPQNLVLSVSKSSNKLNSLIELLKDGPFRKLKSIIIYCTKRAQTEQLVQQIRTLLQFNLTPKELESLAMPYHAGLGAYERQKIQNKFLSGKLRIIVATIAFGMGINKKNIRGIIHYNLPKTFESYLQEIGRAGRDGKPAYCHLLLDLDGEDLFSLQSFIYANGIEKPALRKLVGKIFESCKCKNLREALMEYDKDSHDKPTEEKNEFSCPTHPVGLPIESLEMETDIKSDTIYTLLMALELANQSDSQLPNGKKIPIISVFPPTNSMAHVVNYGDDSDMNQMMQQSSLLKMAVFVAKKEMGKMFDLNKFSFSLMKLAKEAGKTVSQVRQELRNLNWMKNSITGKYKRSTLNIRYDSYSYHLKAPGDLDDEQHEAVVEYLSNAISAHEKSEIYKLRLVYSIFSEHSIEMLIKTDPDDDPKLLEDFQAELTQKSDALKQFLNGYFQDDFNCDYDSSKLKLPVAFQMKYQPLPDIALQISKFINIHYDQGVNTPRRMTRILQGISSPKFPADIWARVRDFWKSLPMIDFDELMKLCSQQINARYSFKLQSKE